jgi:DNA-binding CsgD family transcriptional regulator/PAS domain-containing protein
MEGSVALPFAVARGAPIGAVMDWQTDPAVLETIAAIRRLAGAHHARLLALDPLQGGVHVAPTVDELDRLVDRAVEDVLLAQGQMMFPHSVSRWVDDGGDDALVLRIGEFEGRAVFLVLYFDADASLRNRVSVMVPDLVALMSNQLEAAARLSETAARANAAIMALDHEECGIIVVRRDQSMVMANRAARAILDAQAGLHARRGTVRPNDYQDAIRFQEALDRLTDPPAGRAAERRSTALLLAASKSERPSIVVLTPVASSSYRDSLPSDAAAVIYVLQPFDGVPNGLETVCKLHNLSRVETRLLVNLTIGLTITEAASQMRIKVETARAYLKQIFVKTGVHRQTELVALVFGYLRALKGEFEFQTVMPALNR